MSHGASEPIPNPSATVEVCPAAFAPTYPILPALLRIAFVERIAMDHEDADGRVNDLWPSILGHSAWHAASLRMAEHEHALAFIVAETAHPTASPFLGVARHL